MDSSIISRHHQNPSTLHLDATVVETNISLPSPLADNQNLIPTFVIFKSVRS